MVEISSSELSDETRDTYRALLVFLERQGFEDAENRQVVAYLLTDGTYRFSIADSFDVWLEVTKESSKSDRLLTIVSMAYLEDQVRLLLAKSFINEDVSYNLLDPVQSPLASIVPMANLACSLGLLAREWLDILKQMARLRNIFAYTPSARSFDDLALINPKYHDLIQFAIDHLAVKKGPYDNSHLTKYTVIDGLSPRNIKLILGQDE